LCGLRSQDVRSFPLVYHKKGHGGSARARGPFYRR
jgi:hypothetical protein